MLGNKDAVYPVLSWVLANHEDLAKRAYLARMLTLPCEVPLKHTFEEEFGLRPTSPGAKTNPEQSATGRILEYDPATRQARVVVRGLSFANGVALSPDERHLYVAETGRYRVWKVAVDDPARVGQAYWGGYGVAQHGLRALLAMLAAELAATPVRVAGLQPGPMRTGLRARAYAEDHDLRLRDAGAYARACVTLLGPAGAAHRGTIWSPTPDEPPA